MDQTHLHLMLNHFPFLGTLFGVCVFMVGWLKKEKLLITTGLVTLLIAAFLVIPVYITGNNAVALIENKDYIDASYIDAHEQSAQWAVICMMVAGSIALMTLFIPVFTDQSQVIQLVYAVTLLAGILSVILMAYTAYQGGKISHPELLGSEGHLPITSGCTTSTSKEVTPIHPFVIN